jgi:hypothetical protein
MRAAVRHREAAPSRAAPTAAKRRHNHRLCIEDALDRADSVCATRGARLTPIRRRVLEIVWGQHQPIGAYAILEALQERTGAGAAARGFSLDRLTIELAGRCPHCLFPPRPPKGGRGE